MDANKKEKAVILGFLAGACLLSVGSSYLYSHKDMTGASYYEIEQYRLAHPHKIVSYTVTITGGAADLKLTEQSTTVTLQSIHQLNSLIDQSEYLQHLTKLSFGELIPQAEDIYRLQQAFPTAEIGFAQVWALDHLYPYDTTWVDFSHLTDNNFERAVQALDVLTAVETVYLSAGSDVSNVSLDNAFGLFSLRPDLQYQYTVELFGQTLSTDMEQVEYFKVKIGDEGLTEFRKLLPLMYNLTYFKLDWCDTTNEAMAQLRDDFAPQGVKVVWRVFFDHFNCLTDTLKIWATYTVSTRESKVLKYCTDVRYLDLGHNSLASVEFCSYMPDLEVLIIAICNNLDSIEPLRNCTKLEFLEVFTTKVTDLSPLENLTNLQYLNISNIPCRDITPLYGLPNLKKLNSTMNSIPSSQIKKFRELHPDCDATFLYGGDPTDFGWRYDRYGEETERYALLRRQIGYKKGDYSEYPRGYVTEPIN